MRNILIIWRKEMGSYFVSAIAYLMVTMFALIFGFFFWNALGYFVKMGMESQMRGQSFPLNRGLNLFHHGPLRMPSNQN